MEGLGRVIQFYLAVFKATWHRRQTFISININEESGSHMFICLVMHIKEVNVLSYKAVLTR